MLRVSILDDATHLHIRQGERLRHNLQFARLHDAARGTTLPSKFTIVAVRPDRPRPDVVDLLVRIVQRNRNVPVLPPFFGQNLDSNVIRLLSVLIVAVRLAGKNSSPARPEPSARPSSSILPGRSAASRRHPWRRVRATVAAISSAAARPQLRNSHFATAASVVESWTRHDPGAQGTLDGKQRASGKTT